jgi:hypothetical protein
MGNDPQTQQPTNFDRFFAVLGFDPGKETGPKEEVKGLGLFAEAMREVVKERTEANKVKAVAAIRQVIDLKTKWDDEERKFLVSKNKFFNDFGKVVAKIEAMSRGESLTSIEASEAREKEGVENVVPQTAGAEFDRLFKTLGFDPSREVGPKEEVSGSGLFAEAMKEVVKERTEANKVKAVAVIRQVIDLKAKWDEEERKFNSAKKKFFKEFDKALKRIEGMARGENLASVEAKEKEEEGGKKDE